MPRQTVEDIHEKLETLKLQSEVETERVTIAEKKAMIRELKKRYGPNWKKVLGNIRDNQSLRQFAGTRFRLV